MAVAAVLLLVPGGLLAGSLGLGAPAALSLAPVVSVALYALLAICYGIVGIPASPLTLFVPLALLGAALMVIRRLRGTRGLALLDVSECLSGKVASSSRIGWPVLSIAAALVSALLVALFVFVVNIGTPDTFLNNYDIAFHLSRVREFMDSGNYSSLQGGFYPSAWHCVAAMVCTVTGCSVPSAVLSSILAFAVIAFPLGTYYLLATLFPDNPRRVFLGSLFCLCVAFFPWRIMLFGPLYPNVASFSLLPAVAALFMRMLAPSEAGRGRGACIALFLLGGIALSLAQPNTVFFAALATFPVFITIFTTGFFSIIMLLILILFGVSYALLVWLDYSQWAFDRFINPNMGIATGRGLYNKEKGKENAAPSAPADSAAMREYRRLIVAQGKSKLVCRPIKPIDDDLEVYQLPDSFSRDDLAKLRESKQAIEDDTRAFEEEHKNDERYVEYNRQFEERERALKEEDEGKKKKKKQPARPKMLNKR